MHTTSQVQQLDATTEHQTNSQHLEVPVDTEL